MKNNILNKKFKLFLSIIYSLALFSLISSIFLLKYISPTGSNNIGCFDFFLFVLLSLLSDFFPIKYQDIAISTGFAITIALIMRFGLFWTILIKGLSVALRYVRINNRSYHILNSPFYKTLFNISTIAISIYLGGLGFYFPLLLKMNISTYLILAIKLTLFVILFLFSNVTIISSLATFLYDSSFIVNFKKYLSISFLDIVFMSPFGVILYILHTKYAAIGALIFIFPIIMLRYVLLIYLD